MYLLSLFPAPLAAMKISEGFIVDAFFSLRKEMMMTIIKIRIIMMIQMMMMFKWQQIKITEIFYSMNNNNDDDINDDNHSNNNDNRTTRTAYHNNLQAYLYLTYRY
jgi:hypothetical protein